MRLWVGEATKLCRRLERQVIRLSIGVVGGVERIRAVFEHGLREPEGGIHSVNVEVAEHGIGFPSAEQLDGLFVHVCAEECGGTSWA